MDYDKLMSEIILKRARGRIHSARHLRKRFPSDARIGRITRLWEKKARLWIKKVKYGTKAERNKIWAAL
jgi:hypothetical protein